ncbi:MAG: hydrogenase maturation protease [Spirochaetes bacterium]|jgi:hydrogenase 3 maturation protease|nr:hydrogenase maturation protease [Spirochaetota bacterium]
MEVLDKIESLLKDNTCLVGMGNYLRSDDAVGLYIVDELRDREVPGNLSILNVEDVIESYVYKIAGLDCDNVVILDAVKADSTIGSIVFGRLNDFEELLSDYSTHKLSLKISGKILEEHNKQIYLLGIVADNLDYGTGISDEVKKSADLLKDFIIKSIASNKGVCQ